MTIYLIRHCKAGDRETWRDNDRMRPLSGRGHHQARLLVDLLHDATFGRVLSSPYIRCMETVVPLASVRGLPVEPADALAEGAALDDVLTLVRKHAMAGAALCTHGDVVPMLLDHYEETGVDVPRPREWPKGCTWVLETDNTGEVARARYVAPPFI